MSEYLFFLLSSQGQMLSDKRVTLTASNAFDMIFNLVYRQAKNNIHAVKYATSKHNSWPTLL
jgi:hypothetical protein